MNKIGLIIKSEYTRRVVKKSFLLLTFLMPVLFVGLLLVPLWLSTFEDDAEKKIAVVDQTGKYGQSFRSTDEFRFEVVGEPVEKMRDGWKRSEYEAVVLISNDLKQNPSVTIYSEKQVRGGLKSFVQNTLSEFVENEKLEDYQIPDLKQMIESSRTEVQVSTIKWTEDGGEQASSSEMAGIIGMVFTMLIYLFIFSYGSQVMNSVVQEKTNRIVEVLICSVKPFELMMGKIISVALVGLTQFSMWILLTLCLVWVGEGFVGDFNVAGLQQSTQMAMDEGSAVSLSGEILQAFAGIDFVELIGFFVIYFIGGYLLYASIFAAIGSAVDNETDTQQFMLPVTVPILFAIYAAIYSVQNPDGPLAFWCSIIPLTSPIVMMVRLPFEVSLWEKFLSVGLLIGTFVCTTWMAGKIYRTGILMYGKKASWKEMWKWLTYKDK